MDDRFLLKREEGKRLYKLSKLIGVLLLSIFAITLSTTAFALDLDDLKQQKKALEAQMSNIKDNLVKVQKEQKDVATQLAEIEQELKKAQNELAIAEAKLKETEEKLAKTEKELKAAEEQVEKQEDDLCVRMRTLYKTGPVDYIEVILGSNSFSDFLTRLETIKRVIEADKLLLAEFKKQKDLVKQKRDELKEQEAQILAQKNIINERKATIVSRQGERKKLMEQLKKEEEEYERQYQQLLADSAALTKKIQELQAKNKRAYMGTGEFRWPVPSSSRVTSDYGWRIHPILKTKRFHDGIDIGAPTGSSVVAADDGVVIYTGWYGGYGNTIIVDHGGGISTQYSHLSKILVENGEKVSKGDEIGLVGSTGLSTGPHLHFTVRKNGELANPWNWLK